MSRLFGTDGVRGVANASLTPELAFALGRAGAVVLAEHAARASGGGPPDTRRPLVVGRDTRLSGPMLESALVAGIASSGYAALTLGIVPTPGVARVAAQTDAFAGAMISASHNPIGDNGIKFFAFDGTKLDDALEAEIERAMAAELPRPTHAAVGTVRPAHELARLYEDALLASATSLDGLTVVVDAACGAAYRVAPHVFAALGARVVAINAEDDGARINVANGSTNLTELRARVRDIAAREPRARVVGVAFDGDADRALFVDETGGPIDGDRVMMILARERKRAGTLAKDAVVGTVMSNLGLERALAEDGIALVRAAVGDRYVLQTMRAGGFRFGGEQSGHIIDLDRNTTGDGPMTAIALFGHLVRDGARLHDLAARLRTVPQLLVNVRSERRGVLDGAPVAQAIARAEASLGDRGRILVRASGTEPLLRVMVEGDDDALVERIAREVAETIRLATLN